MSFQLPLAGQDEEKQIQQQHHQGYRVKAYRNIKINTGKKDEKPQKQEKDISSSNEDSDNKSNNSKSEEKQNKGRNFFDNNGEEEDSLYEYDIFAKDKDNSNRNLISKTVHAQIINSQSSNSSSNNNNNNSNSSSSKVISDVYKQGVIMSKIAENFDPN